MSSAGIQNKTIEVEIERLLPGGVGLAHAEGMTLFVSLAAAGDVARVRLDRVQGKVGFASIVEVIRPSPERVEPPCPYFGRCGGCDFQQLNYEAQLSAKVEIIRDCLRRIARVDDSLEIPIMPSLEQWQYRSRANWQLDTTTNRLGYFERGSHQVCEVEYCAVLAPELQKTLEELRSGLSDRRFNQKLVEFDAVCGDEGVSVAPSSGHSRAADVTRTIAGETYQFSAEAFFQVNHGLLELLIGEAVRDVKGRTAIDLYCGVGLFTLPLARRFVTVTGVEGNRRAAEFARRNLESAGLDNNEIANLGVSDWLKQFRAFEQADFLLLDPPRSGAEAGVIENIVTLRPRQISYVACDPATFARDLKKLLDGGYNLDSIVAFDMFPQTHHVETVTRLSQAD